MTTTQSKGDLLRAESRAWAALQEALERGIPGKSLDAFGERDGLIDDLARASRALGRYEVREGTE